jgi:hypothetical protein
MPHCAATGSAVFRLTKLAALLLVAFWLPATQHCALEAAGMLSTTCLDHCDAAESSGKDGCGSIENGSYKPTGNTLKVAAPQLLTCLCFLCLHLEPKAPDGSRSLIGGALRQADAWIPTWQFVRRAAPLPGAPSLFLA